MNLSALTDSSATRKRLIAGGIGTPAATAKADLFVRSAQALLEAGAAGDAEAPAFFVPGRLEVLGKHTDYAGGRSVVAATEQGICLAAVPRDDAAIGAFALDLDEQCDFPLSPELAPTVGHWSNYLATVARRVAGNFPGRLRGASIAFAGDLPAAAGLSSSSALIVACFLALSGVNDLPDREEYRRNIRSQEDLAGYLGTVENGQTFGSLEGGKGVGTFGGSEDHTAMLCCKPGMLSQYSYCPVRLERRIDMPDGYVFAIAASGVAAEKTGPAMEKYNRASRLAAAVVAAWNEATGRDDPHVAAALASDDLVAAADRMRRILLEKPGGGPFSPRELRARFEHFLTESEHTIPAAGDMLAGGSAGLAEFGRLVDRSQQFAETLLGNQIPETSFLARCARKAGAVAASAFGAGFGGSVWALERQDKAEALLEHWARQYEEAFPAAAAKASFFLTQPGPAALQLT